MPLACHDRRDTQRVLGLVNRIRTDKLSLPPLKRLKPGRLGIPWSCSIAASLSTPTKYKASVDEKGIVVTGRTNEDAVVTLGSDDVPKYLGEWIARFDDGAFPELVTK
jgi:hypothetical protein